MPLPSEFHNALLSAQIETRLDPATRVLYSTDASNYQIEPLGVVFPRDGDQISAVVELAAQFQVPLIPRGAGSGLAGQTVGAGLVIDCSRYLDQIIDLNPEERTVTVQPGLVLTRLNQAAAQHGLQFGPDPASADRATLGGVLGCNATGAHSIQYGMAADHLLSTEVVLADGRLATFGQISLEDCERKIKQAVLPVDGDPGTTDFYAAIINAALQIRTNYASEILTNWPKVWRRASGYNLNYLLPWSPTMPPQWYTHELYPPIPPKQLNLAAVFAGAEGTLGIIRQAKLRLVKKPLHTILAVLPYASIADAADDAPRLLEMDPSAIELIPHDLIELARSVPAYARMLTFVEGTPAALLAVEFAGDDVQKLQSQIAPFRQVKGVYIAESVLAQSQIWKVRKVGLGLLMSRSGDAKPGAVIEDVSVPVEHLGEYVREIERITADYGVSASYYAHASAGCLHIRPIINLKDERGMQALRGIAEQAMAASRRFNGVPSGEHGDGFARSEWLVQTFGPKLMEAHRLLKDAADPDGIMNPGKIIDPPPMDRNLRFGVDYRSQGWQPILSFDRQKDLAGAIEMCNGAGVCRQPDGVMCPSFQATREEMHTTRGRANLLRALISHKPSGAGNQIDEDTVYQALDLCLACKGCKSECPSAVDVAKLKYEFLQHYYRNHGRLRRDYLFGYIDRFAALGRPFGPLINFFMKNERLRGVFSSLFGLAPERKFPAFARSPLHLPSKITTVMDKRPPVLLLVDAFTRYFYPAAGTATLKALDAAGYAVKVLPLYGAGRTLISKGFLDQAKKHAQKLVAAIIALDPEGQIPVVGIEPSEIFTLSDEYPEFFPGNGEVAKIAARAWMIDEFLIRPDTDSEPRFSKIYNWGSGKVLLHGHCYQKARPPADDGYPVGMDATVALLEAVGYSVEVIDAGCCGMAGAFGYEVEHHELSMQVGEMRLFPALRSAADDVIVAACGVSCQTQIEDGTQRTAIHPITLLDR